MSMPVERRIQALEIDAGCNVQPLRVVIARVGETGAQARQRLGIEPDTRGVIAVLFGVAAQRQN